MVRASANQNFVEKAEVVIASGDATAAREAVRGPARAATRASRRSAQNTVSRKISRLVACKSACRLTPVAEDQRLQ